MKHTTTKKALIFSLISMIMCVSMLVGSTYAWFTDTATTGVNTIVAGNLDIGLKYSSDFAKWTDAEASSEIFDADAKWEPGYTEVVYFEIENKGTLAFNFRIGTNLVANKTGLTEKGDKIDLTEHIKFGIVKVTSAFATREDALAAVKSPVDFGNLFVAEDSLDTKGAKATYAMVVYMPTTVGNEANHNGKDIPSIEFGVQVIASQKSYENDGFGNDYDADATYPDFAFVAYDPSVENKIEGDLFEATIPATAILQKADGTPLTNGTEIVMNVEETAVNPNITVNIGSVAETYEVTLKTSEGEKVSASGDTITVNMQIGAGRTGTIKLYHNESLIDSNYDAATGILTFETDSFSPYTVVETIFEADSSWYNNTDTEFTLTTIGELYGFAALVNNGNNFSGKTVKLGADIDLNNEVWTPIGKGNKNSFQGIFDGQNYTVSNLNAVTASGWYNGLFGYVKSIEGNPDSIIKNFTINNANVTGNATSSAAVIGEVFCATVENVTVKGDVVVNGGAYTGGIVGKGYSSITNCHIKANEGSVISSVSSYLGGIIGHRGEGSSYDINGCSIENVTITGSSIVGGIAGISQTGNKITNCTLNNVTVVYKNVSDSVDYSGIGAISGWSLNNVSITGNSFTGTIETPYTLYNDKVTGLGYNGAAQSGLVLDNNSVNATVVAE